MEIKIEIKLMRKVTKVLESTPLFHKTLIIYLLISTLSSNLEVNLLLSQDISFRPFNESFCKFPFPSLVQILSIACKQNFFNYEGSKFPKHPR